MAPLLVKIARVLIVPACGGLGLGAGLFIGLFGGWLIGGVGGLVYGLQTGKRITSSHGSTDLQDYLFRR